MDQRQAALHAWLQSAAPAALIGLAADWQLLPVSGDASFRRYFRVQKDAHSWIAVDAPPEQEDSQPFIDVAQALAEQGVHVPEVLAYDLQQGFMLQTDLGDALYLNQLTEDTADNLYGDALFALEKIQACRQLPGGRPLPAYDRALLDRELALFSDWFIGQWLGLELTEHEQQVLNYTFNRLAETALEQPRVCVHRDYHSRNLLITEDSSPAVIDFQDAVFGPITYDLVSLVRDLYIDWPPEQVHRWMTAFADRQLAAGKITPPQRARFNYWFDLMGMQRHMKAIGIFARLWLRDGKSGYLADIPRGLMYLEQMTQKHPEFVAFYLLLRDRIKPAMAAKTAQPELASA